MNNLLKLLTVLAIIELSTASYEIYIHQVAQPIQDTTSVSSCWYQTPSQLESVQLGNWYTNYLLKLNASWPTIYEGNYNTYVWDVNNVTLVSSVNDTKTILRRFCEIKPQNGVYDNDCSSFIYNAWYAMEDDVSETYDFVEKFEWAPDYETDYKELVDNAENNQPDSKTVTHQFAITYTPDYSTFKCVGYASIQFDATTYVQSSDAKGTYRLDAVDIKLLDLGRLGLSAGDKDTFTFTFHQLVQQTGREQTFYEWQDAKFTIEKEITIQQDMTINLDTSDEDHNVFTMIQNYQYIEGHSSVGIRMTQGAVSLFEDYQRSEVKEDAGNVIDPFTTIMYTVTFEGKICDSDECKKEAEEEEANEEEGNKPDEEEEEIDGGGSANIMKSFVSVFAALFVMLNL